MTVPIFRTGLTQHFYLDFGDGTGLHLAEVNGRARRERLPDITLGRKPRVVAELPAHAWPAMRRRAEAVTTKPYSLATWNCEHFANYVAYGERRSGQIAGAGALGLFAVIVVAVVALWPRRR